MVEITIRKADSNAINFETLTTGMVNAVWVHFDFSEHWEGLTKIAVFTNGIRSINVPEAAWTDNSCTVPSEVLQVPWRTVRCGVYGMRGETLVLPAVMVGIGRVKPGTDPNGDPGTDPELPVWAQLEGRVTELEKETAEAKKSACYTELTKNALLGGNTIQDGTEILRVHLRGLDSLDWCPELRVYRCLRRRDRRYQWQHPGNWNSNGSTGNTRMGYGLLVGTHFATHENGPLYPEVPDWMPNDGFLQTVFPIDADALSRGYIEIDLRSWVIPLLKPVDPMLEWHQCGMVGIQSDSTKAPLLFRFRINRDGKDLGECRNTLCVGFRKGRTPKPNNEGVFVSDGYLDLSGKLRAGRLYTSIR